MPPIAESLEAVRRRIEAACVRSDRDPATVRLIAVSKTVPAERIRELLAAGHSLLGENRVQEVLHKIPELPEVTWHFIGHLQRNKARHVVGQFELIHGVDGESLAQELDRRTGGAGLRQAVLVQVNLSGEETKSGVPPDRLSGLLDVMVGLDALELRGLMTIPPPVNEPEMARRWFAGLRELRDRQADRLGLALPDLSMGMTDDFEIAVEEGATLVRVGRAIFGERPKNVAPGF